MRKIIITVILIIAAITVWIIWDNNRLVVSEYSIDDGSIDKGLRIVQISDFHNSRKMGDKMVSKVNGNEPKEEDPNSGNSGNINTNTNTNTNDIDNTQTVNEAPVTQNVDDGDVNVSNNNNVDMPDFSNNVNLPGANNIITFNPTIEVKLPENTIERTVISGMQSRYPDVVKSTNAAPAGRCGNSADIKTGSAENKDGVTDTDAASASTSGEGTTAGAPQTGDGMNLGVLMALIATVVISGTTGGVMLRRRLLERRR